LRSGGHGVAHARERRGTAGGERGAAASGGANSKRHWGAPFAAGFAPRRRARACEPNWGVPKRRRRGTAAHGEARRSSITGDDEPAERGTALKSNRTGGLLTTRRIHGAGTRRPSGGGTARARGDGGPRRRRRGLGLSDAAARELGVRRCEGPAH
jgi:hypothetical protein